MNLDGKTTASDYLLLKRYLILAEPLSDESKACADVNGDGRLTASDYLGLKRMLLA